MNWFLNDKGFHHERVNNHTNHEVGKAMKCVDFLGRFQHFLPCSSPLTIYKSFIRPHLDYGDVIYGQLSNISFRWP